MVIKDGNSHVPNHGLMFRVPRDCQTNPCIRLVEVAYNILYIL